MPWQVELPGAAGTAPETVTVEGTSWKLALAAARDGRALTKFRCEFDADGTMRVHDLVADERFALRQTKGNSIVPGAPPRDSLRPSVAPRESTLSVPPSSVAPAVDENVVAAPPPSAATATAPDAGPSTVAATTQPESVPGTAVPPSAVAPVAPVATPDAAPVPPAVETAPPRSTADVTAPSAVFEPAREISRPSFGVVRAEIAVPAPATLVYQRNRDPEATGGITFRERVLALPPDSGVAEAERVAGVVFEQLRASIENAPLGRLVSIAVFDHGFRRRPERPPLVVLTWADWRGDVQIERATTGASVPPPAEASPPEPAAADARTAAPPTTPPVRETSASRPVVAAPEQSIIVDPGVSAETVVGIPPPRAAAVPASRTPASGRRDEKWSNFPSPPPSTTVRAPGDDLLAAAFEATQDLALLSDPDEACAFVARVVVNVLGVAAAVVTQYDIDRDELRLASAVGVLVTEARAVPLATGPRGEAALRNRVIVLPSLPGEDEMVPAVPTGPVLYAPARHDQRLFAIVQIHRDPGHPTFAAGEQQAAQYIATRLGDFLATHSRRVGFDDPAARPRSTRPKRR